MAASRDTSASVAAITVSYGSAEVLPTLLASLRAATTRELDTIVVDNAAEPRVAELAERSGVRYLPLAANPGYGAAVNAGVRTLSPAVEWILVVNPDVVLEPGSIDALVAVADGRRDVAAVGPAILSPEGALYPSARQVPSLRTGIGHALFSGAWPGNPWSRRYRQEDDPDPRDAGWLSGACLLLRRSAFDAVGGFDEGYFMYFEDVDLGMRLGRAGWRNRYEPAARVVHSGAHSTTRSHAAMVKAHHDSANRFLSRKYPGVMWLPVRLVLRLGLRVRALLVRLRNRG
jgi:N-acetylglucosaminyl-diphospho-decaprenol L-rhamnosyltransferase